jgi:hypothetical protein
MQAVLQGNPTVYAICRVSPRSLGPQRLSAVSRKTPGLVRIYHNLILGFSDPQCR